MLDLLLENGRGRDNVSEANCSGATNTPHLDLSVSCEASMLLDHHVRGSPIRNSSLRFPQFHFFFAFSHHLIEFDTEVR